MRLSRRAFLGGAATMLGLPYLEAMVPSGTRGAVLASEIPVHPNLLFYYVPNGMHMPSWTPVDAGSGFTLSPILEPLTAHREELLVVSGLANRNAIDNVAGDHARGTGAFLTARLPRKTESEDIENGISVDQVAAQAIGAGSRFASLQLGAEGGGSVGSCDSGYSCAYSNNISWAGPASPLAKMTSPTVVLERLFGGYDEDLTQVEVARRRQHRASVLDYVLEESTALQATLGASDRDKLEEYLTAVRELELRVDRLGAETCGDVPTVPEGWVTDLPAYSAVMNDLMVMAMRCDLTHIISFMLGKGGSNRSYDFLGVSGAHHEISHHQNLEENFAKLEIIDRWEVEQFADLLTKMRAETMPDGSTLLDHSLAFFSSEIEDGNAHRHTNLPILLAGRGSGAVSPGRHIRFAEEQPIANLFISMLNAVGVSVGSFGGDGTGPLSELS